MQSVISQAVKLSAAWDRGIPAAEDLPDVPVPIATSQAGEPPTTPDLRLLSDLVEDGKLPVDMLWLALERSELLPQGAHVDLQDLAELEEAGEEPGDDGDDEDDDDDDDDE